MTTATPIATRGRRLPYAFESTLPAFLETATPTIIGALSSHAGSRRWDQTVDSAQIRAWEESLTWLRDALQDLNQGDLNVQAWHLCLEYEIPRRGSRIDAVLLAHDIVIPIEFKSGACDASARRQAEDYGLELLDFHEQSQARRILPLACAGQGILQLETIGIALGSAHASTCGPSTLAQAITGLFEAHHQPGSPPIVPIEWLHARYEPTPTIIEAAKALYAGHQVRDLAQSEASEEQLRATQDAVAEVVKRCWADGKKTICFITGVPGAGKTLAGLNIVHGLPKELDATFLSGNGPLVKVLQTVLARDLQAREGVNKSDADREATTLVTNVHRWLDHYVDKAPTEVPHEGVVVFDEAQRAWNRKHSMRKFSRDASEPEMMLEAMSRRSEAVIVGLVGGGQEINTGEAGLSEWGRALAERFDDWDIVVSPELLSGSLEAGTALFPDSADVPLDRVTTLAQLHLSVPKRSYRSQAVSTWVEHVLQGRPDEACLLMEELSNYPIVMTRDLDVAREWVRKQTRGMRRSGLLASSGARRLRQHGIVVQETVDPVHWFLDEPEDIRSSNFLELPMTEFGVQGLEVDWACVAWGGDLTRNGDDWMIRSLRGSKWQAVHQEDARAYAINRYRVLLTRAREGLVIWIPCGSPDDATRDPTRYASVEAYIQQCGVRSI